MNALTAIEDFNEYFSVKISDEEFDTIGGVIVNGFGRMPKKGESINIENFIFKISEANSRQVKLLEMQIISK